MIEPKPKADRIVTEKKVIEQTPKADKPATETCMIESSGHSNIHRVKTQNSVKLVNPKQEFDHLINQSQGKPRTPGLKKKKKKKSALAVVEEYKASDYEFGLKTCMIIHQRRYGKFRQLPQV